MSGHAWDCHIRFSCHPPAECTCGYSASLRPRITIDEAQTIPLDQLIDYLLTDIEDTTFWLLLGILGARAMDTDRNFLLRTHRASYDPINGKKKALRLLKNYKRKEFPI